MISFRLQVLAALALSALCSCTFNYSTDGSELEVVPDMVLTQAAIDRYEDGYISMNVSAAALEMYDKESVWAGEGVAFTSFSADNPDQIDSTGSAGMLLIDERAGLYSLGETAYFYIASDDMSIHAAALRWEKNANILSGPLDSEVLLVKGDGTTIRGNGFFADTLRYAYRFESRVSGTIVTASESDEEELDVQNDK